MDSERFEPTPEQMVAAAGLEPAAAMPTPDIALAGAAIMAAEVDETPVLVSPKDTVGWRAARKDGIETFTSPDNIDYVRTRSDEEADLIITFPRTRGMTDMRLVRADQSTTVARAARKKRREERELRKRGYDV
jgi:hypothetical protein